MLKDQYDYKYQKLALLPAIWNYVRLIWISTQENTEWKSFFFLFVMNKCETYWSASYLGQTYSERQWKITRTKAERNPKRGEKEIKVVHLNLHEMTYLRPCTKWCLYVPLKMNDSIHPQGQILDFHGGGGGAKDYVCARTQRAQIPKSLMLGSKARPLKGPGSSTWFLMCYCAIWALF